MGTRFHTLFAYQVSSFGPSALASFGTPDRETQERLARERATEEQEKRLAAKQAELEAKLEVEAMQLTAEQKRIAELEAVEPKEGGAGEGEQQACAGGALLPHGVGPAGHHRLLPVQAQGYPSLVGLMEHIKRQGFHVVFAAQPNQDEVEPGHLQYQERWTRAMVLGTVPGRPGQLLCCHEGPRP